MINLTKSHRRFLVLSVLLVALFAVAWIQSVKKPWQYSLKAMHGDFHLRMSSEKGEFQIGETHHFEVWRAAYWKLLLLSCVPALWVIRHQYSTQRKRGFEVMIMRSEE